MRKSLLTIKIYLSLSCVSVEWEKAISNTLDRHPSRHKYILLRSSQLVGTALIIYARADIVPAIRNIEGAIKKVNGSNIMKNDSDTSDITSYILK